MSQTIINRDPDILGGTPVFMGMCVSIKALFECLEVGDGLGELLDNFPSVKRKQVLGLLEVARVYIAGADEGA